MATKAKQIPVSIRAVVQRINRKLAEKDEQFKKCRSETQAWHNLGDYYIVDIRRNFVVDTHCDPEAVGRKLGVLRPWEVVADE